MKVEFVTDQFLHGYFDLELPFPAFILTTINGKKASFIYGTYLKGSKETPCYFQNNRYLTDENRTLRTL